MNWFAYVDGDSPAYDEQSADRVDIFTEDSDHVATLYRAESCSRWTDVRPEDVTGETILWCDVETYCADPDGANLSNA
jgi:hypothetical protein